MFGVSAFEQINFMKNDVKVEAGRINEAGRQAKKKREAKNYLQPSNRISKKLASDFVITHEARTHTQPMNTNYG